MKWYSIKRFTPPSGINLFVRAVYNDPDFISARYFVGMIEIYEDIQSLSEWLLANGEQHQEINVAHYKITHFAVIDPVEIDD